MTNALSLIDSLIESLRIEEDSIDNEIVRGAVDSRLDALEDAWDAITEAQNILEVLAKRLREL